MFKRGTRYIGPIALAAAIAMPAAAREPGAAFQYPVGTSLGTPLGANPPPGVYLSNVANYYANSSTAANSSVAKPGVNLTAFAEAPKFIWSTPWTILGATESMYVTIPFVDLTVTNRLGTNRSTGMADTAFSPLNLSWKFGNDFYVTGIFSFVAPDGQYDVTHRANIAANFWTFEPEIALSYLNSDYDITVHALYNTNTKNTATNYTSGDQFIVEAYASKFFGKWQVGAVTYFDDQITKDTNNGTTFPKTNMTNPEQFALGGLVGYNFGPLKIQAWLTQDVQAKDGAGQGTRFWTRVLIPLY